MTWLWRCGTSQPWINASRRAGTSLANGSSARVVSESSISMLAWVGLEEGRRRARSRVQHDVAGRHGLARQAHAGILGFLAMQVPDAARHDGNRAALALADPAAAGQCQAELFSEAQQGAIRR